MKYATCLILICGALGLSALAQDYPRLRVDPKWVPTTTMFEENLYRENEKRVQEGSFDTRAEAVLRASESFTKDVFAFSKLSLLKASTYSQYFNGPSRKCPTNYDTLLVEWAVEAPFGGGTLILEDTPIESIYVLRQPARAIMSRDDLTVFLAAILIDERPPLNLSLSKWTFTTSAGPGITAFDAVSIGSANSLLKTIAVAGVSRGRDAYVYVRVTKDYAEKYYQLPHLVPERFPPLAELAKSWSFDRVLAEVGKEGCSEERDTVLLVDLVKRELPTDQFLQLLIPSGGNTSEGLSMRAGQVMHALHKADRAEVSRRYFGAALQAYAGMGGTGDGAASALFNWASLQCAPEYEAAALRNLGGVYSLPAMEYLGQCSTSRESLAALERLRLVEQPANVRDRAVQAIRRRIGGTPAKEQ